MSLLCELSILLPNPPHTHHILYMCEFPRMPDPNLPVCGAPLYSIPSNVCKSHCLQYPLLSRICNVAYSPKKDKKPSEWEFRGTVNCECHILIHYQLWIALIQKDLSKLFMELQRASSFAVQHNDVFRQSIRYIIDLARWCRQISLKCRRDTWYISALVT